MANSNYNSIENNTITNKGPSRQPKRNSIVASFKNFFKRQFSSEALPIDKSDSPPCFGPASFNKQEELWVQACYNAAAMVFVFITACVILAVYYVLEPFLHPLLWAVLVGMVLHPFKHICTSEITKWLHYIQNSGMSLSLGTVFIPLFVINWLSKKLESVVVSNVWTIAKLTVGAVVCMALYVLSIPLYIYWWLQYLYQMLDGLSVITSSLLYLTLGSLLLGFVILTVINDLSENSLSIFASSILWFLVLLNVSFYLFGSLAIPATICLFLVAMVLSLVWKNDTRVCYEPIRPVELLKHGTEKEHVSAVVSRICPEQESSSDSMAVKDKTHVTLTSPIPSGEDEYETLSITSGLLPTSADTFKESSDNQMKKPKSCSDSMMLDTKAAERKVSGMRASKSVSYIGLAPLPKTGNSLSIVPVDGGTSVMLATMPNEEIDGAHVWRIGRPKSQYVCKSAESALRAQKSNNYAFVVLIAACCLIFIWKHPLILFLLVPLILWVAFGRIFYLYIQPQIQLQFSMQVITSEIASLFGGKMRLFFPPPIITLGRMFLFLDHMIIKLAVKSVGEIVSMCIIAGLLVGVSTASVLLVLQIYVELGHYVAVGAVVWNKTLAANPQILKWLNSSRMTQDLISSLEIVTQQGYEFGRNFLAQQIHSMVAGSFSNTSLVEKQVLDIFDQVYHNYFLKKNARPSVYFTLEQAAMDESLGALFAELKLIFLNNLETIFSVLRSVGTLISENMSVTLSFLYALLQVLFSGGTALVNMVVFMSALFYLLKASNERYLPVQWVLELVPQLSPPKCSVRGDGGCEKNRGGSEQAEAFQRAIRSVFYATFRRASFYGLYTWLLHNVMGISVSILPAVVAAIDGAIPFLGAYWVAIPAILELWLINGRPILAAAMFLLSLLPTFFIEGLINGEIQGGHPYLTGLAIAGGIYIAGLEGALIGPILLCCLIFFMDIYEDIFSK